MKEKPTLPKKQDGSLDKDAIRAMFMASPFMDWYRFAEEHGVDPYLLRRELPVKTWLQEKRDSLVKSQTEILSGILHERRFKWTHEVIKTLDEYPRTIDSAKNLADAKMHSLGLIYKDYLDWLKLPMTDDRRRTKTGRILGHQWEKVSLTELSMLMKGVKDITDAKLKALMIDKWALKKFDISDDELNQDPEATEEEVAKTGVLIQIEGKGEVTTEQLQNFFDMYHDKPAPVPQEHTTKEVTEAGPTTNAVTPPNVYGES